ncbi:glycosyltransferase [Nocardiopsis sp. HNM0947]|uniref:Glycosyltransferase n=1 Tax=Nocardiopsis coralli TaxID=2772213 RepID=A0ABR9PB08_9ACTN|nr:glycosyltransferase family 4 protein [Nocardiopsis coralli]MBE3001026.1 glycosyltransferase [Nocardiopsis coralli]
MRLFQRGVRYLGRHRKETLGAAVAGGLGLTVLLALTGLLTWTAAVQTLAWGALALGTGLALALLVRLDERTGDVRRAVFGGGALLTAQGMAGIAEHAKQARDRADDLYEQGHIQEAVDELVPYAAFDDEADLVRRRIMSERRALGPLTGLPEHTPAAQEPVPGRVLHLVSNALPNSQVGYTVRTHRIVTAQREAGLDPHVVTFPGWPIMAHCDTAPVREVDGIPYHRVRPGQQIRPGLQERIDAAVTDVTALARRLRPAVLHAASDHKNATVALHVGRALGIPVVYELRGFLEETWISGGGAVSRRGTERHHLLVERETSALRQADAVVTLAHTMREEIVRRGVDPERVVLAPNAVDTDLLESRPDGDAFRAAHGIDPHAFVIGSVSTLTHYEGFGTLIEAAGDLHRRGLPIRVLLVGDGAARRELLARVRDLGLEQICVLPGKVGPDEALRAQAALDVMVVPRLDRRVCRLVTPLKPVEAMALGTPVVASDLPALRELLDEGRIGTLVPPEDPAALADAVAELAEDPDLCRQQAKAAREQVLATRTWARNAEAYRDLYARLGVIP